MAEAKDNTITVTLDIAGFYYGEEIEVPYEGKLISVKDVMLAARKRTSFPKLEFTGEVLPVGAKQKEFCDTIIVVHQGGTAKSRQGGGRSYDDGTYLAADDPVFFTKDRLVSPEGKSIVSAWQYYVYDTDFVDLNRRFAAQEKAKKPSLPKGYRVVVPYSIPFEVTDATGELRGIKPGDTIVWRRVSICLAPTTPAEPLIA